MTTTADPNATSDRAFKVVGTRPIRHDGLDKVTGRARYGADLLLPGTLHGKVLRSPHAHARIKRIDTSKAEALPGVKAVVTGADLPVIHNRPLDLGETVGNPRILAENALANKKALYKGHAIAAVAATTKEIAEEALDLIAVDYEVLPAVLTAREAMDDNAPLLHEEMTTRSLAERFSRGTDTGVKSNIGSHIQFKRGDLADGFEQAEVIVEREFTTSTVHQGYIEPHAATAHWGADGRLTVWTSSQGHFGIRGQVASILDLPESRIKVVPMEIGGGFGGKTIIYLEPVAALLSRKAGAPVKLAMSRTEVFEASGPTSAAFMRAKIGADRDGRITAAELELVYEAGAFPGSPVGAGANTGLAPYVIENLVVDGYDVVCNKPKVAAYRAPGSPQAAYAVETVMDELAEKLGIDPLDFRMRNAPHQGDRQPSGVPFPRIGCEEVIAAMQAHPHYSAPLGGPNRGRGVALGYWGNAGNQSSATINVNADGTISLITGSVDIGGSRPALAIQAAEVLGLRAEDVNPSVGDTDSVGWTGVTGGSRTAFSTGLAAIAAAEDVKQQMSARAAMLWECDPEDVTFADGVFRSRSDTEKSLSFQEVASKMLRTGGPVSASAHSNPRQVGPAFAGAIVDVEVDPDTGKVSILRFTVVQDVGKAAHPSYVEGQMQGGAVQGIGWALNEEYVFNTAGAMVNASFLDYRMPTALDLPMIETVLVEVPNPGHPFGLRGVGEVSIVPPPAALANAITAATGVRVNHLPMSPRVVLEALGALPTTPTL
jgi:CO/xanthine dehydrogenase Mo-binding subunit